ncbi:cellulose synthase catalytic subunit [Neoasaia chiangmaiensis NBRC 101099]|uniref:Cellulose synthase catalytic subunit [UDP-forming] n=2 Tax=Neoasaia chiangmaiensis TaxID=320497 RepID=A0A1U9KS08_9PROT|nr:UDP-forming cellulose synthase catalytic subunit [Neoasaia chiangmaiensis]AQS88507.1 hypothetical protein A0U93_11815 [Neoasaia chiangmaiensis]GBR36452.1 cellulose synthase catalytic subunit [Neoasaia chiangmaiensis NBRC 101099]GEN15336.1 hypothetical protein NCH01_17670 [Neoasaia chiangmaiensis]
MRIGNALRQWLFRMLRRLDLWISSTLSGRHRYLLGGLMGIGGFSLLVLGASAYLDVQEQSVVAVAGIVLFFLINRSPSPRASLMLKFLSLLVSMRYLSWRLTETLVFQTWTQAILGFTLGLAELYALVMLLLSYFQTLHPLGRKIVAMPENIDDWPSVDVYVPTYNEDLRIVRLSVLAALTMDWPADRLNVYILDDGHRPEFMEFAQSCGAGYITRANNSHAKAGNLNHAMAETNGDLIAIFDCDHVPTRSFLQNIVGWFTKDPNLALLQTPHHFYSPDPFQRNLSPGEVVPPEGNLFYGLIQDGNDFWNATFFCGSCAVLRRTALEEVGGIATETVTEDMHTALKLQRRGWATAYLRVPMAAGLATERLILHIGQRMRWARGMLQILRLDNPLIGPGLSFAQRLCYFSAIAGFGYAIPRIIFLGSPLVYLFFSQTLIAASPMAIAVYALPHLVHSIATSARVNRNWRYSFWSEIYETTLALFLVRVTIVTLLFPRRGKFNVTDKGGLLERSYLDWTAIYPNVVFATILGSGALFGVWRLVMQNNSAIVVNALWTNLLWISISLIIVLASISVGRESRQIRQSPRVNVRMPVMIRFPDGRLLTGHSTNMSNGGLSFVASDVLDPIDAGQQIQVLADDGGTMLAIPAEILRKTDAHVLSVKWRNSTLLEEAQIIRLVFGRPNAWVNWANYPPDRLAHSAWLVLQSIHSLFRAPKKIAATPPGPRAAPGRAEKRAIMLRPQRSSLLKIVVAALALGYGTDTLAQTPPVVSSPPATAGEPPLPDLPTGNASPDNGALSAHEAAPVPGLDMADGQTMLRSFTQLGSADILPMTPWIPIQGLEFGVPSTQLVTGATLNVFGALSPNMLPAASGVTIFLNDQYVGTIHVDREHPAFGPLAFPVNPLFFKNRNVLTFHFAGQYTETCGNQVSETLWARIMGKSTLSISTAPLPPTHDLSGLPSPFFDPAVREKARIPLVLAADADRVTLKAAAILASWFGSLTDYRGVTFPVLQDAPPNGNAVVVGTAQQVRRFLTNSSPIEGPTLLEVNNPNDAFGTLLLVTGRSAAEVTTAARGLAFTADDLAHAARQTVVPVNTPPRRPYDAPAFINLTRPVRFGELVDLGRLEGNGYVPGTLSVPFKALPDLYTWRNRPFLASVSFRGPLGTEIERSRSHVDISMNDIYLRSYALAPPHRLPAWLRSFWPAASAVQQGHVSIPLWTLYGQNDFRFYFETRPIGQRDCSGMTQDLRSSIDADSTIDLSRAYHFTSLPNLAFFANSGFPYTRMAGLHDTAVVLPQVPSPSLLTGFFDLMGSFGAMTHYPVVNMGLLAPNEVNDQETRDLIVIDSLPGSDWLRGLLADTPYSLDGRSLVYSAGSLLDGIHFAWPAASDERVQTQSFRSSTLLAEGGALFQRQSPYAAHRTVTVLLGGAPQGVDRLVQAMRDQHLQPAIQGDLAIVNGQKVMATRNLPTYTVGKLPLWLWPDFFMRNHPGRVVIAGLVGALLCALVLYKILTLHAAIRHRDLDDAP